MHLACAFERRAVAMSPTLRLASTVSQLTSASPPACSPRLHLCHNSCLPRWLWSGPSVAWNVICSGFITIATSPTSAVTSARGYSTFSWPTSSTMTFLWRWHLLRSRSLLHLPQDYTAASIVSLHAMAGMWIDNTMHLHLHVYIHGHCLLRCSIPAPSTTNSTLWTCASS